MNQNIRRTVIACAVLSASAFLTVAASAEGEKTGLSGWQTENGKRYYYLSETEKAVGEQEIDGISYLFAPNGVQQLGWQTVGGKRWFYDKEGEAVFGWVKWRGETYYVSKTEGKLTGKAETDEGDTFSFDEYGVRDTWQQDADGVWFSPDAEGEMLIDGVPYLFDADGNLLTGRQTASDGITRCYDAETHSVYSGWFSDSLGKSYADGVNGILTGFQRIGSEYYLLDQNGVPLTGLQTDDAGTRCFDESGAMLTGWQVLSDGRRYFDPVNGRMYVGICTVDGACYDFGENGIPQSGWVEKDGLKYYYDETGAEKTGFIETANGMVYLTDAHTLAVGLQLIDAKAYYFNAEGIMQTGWIEMPSGFAYFGDDGVRLYGWITADGVQHYLGTNGIAANGAVQIDNVTYIFGDKGVPAAGWYTAADGTRYYAGADGKATTGWAEIDGKGYYFNANGAMAVSTTVEGYTIDANGVARCQTAVTVDNLLNLTNKTPLGIYSYCVGHYWYSHIEGTRSVDQLINAGWQNLVNYTLVNRGAVCYYLAATMDYFCQRAGYTTRMVHATHSTGNHYWVQVLIDGVWQNYDPTYTNRGNISWDYQIALGSYIILGYLDVDYDARGTMKDYTYIDVYGNVKRF
ncbi:MAG: hypothetical protein IKQ91_05395 [Oscillospiraceae bacterium]|nr:hypothetical protein [Oscillospiraceae bacterium]